MHEKLGNTMTKLEAAPETVNKDLQYKFTVPVPRSRPTRRAARAPAATDGSARVNVYGMGSLTNSGVALSFVVVLSSSRLESGAGSAVRHVGVAS
jgi:hypothetical protein